MNYIKCDVSTVCIGMAASMGAFLLAAGAKGKRYALPNSEIMIHQPLISGGLSGQTTDIKIYSDHLVKTKEKMNRILSERTGKPYEQVCADTERDNFMSAEEARLYGLVDEVIVKKELKQISERNRLKPACASEWQIRLKQKISNAALSVTRQKTKFPSSFWVRTTSIYAAIAYLFARTSLMAWKKKNRERMKRKTS